MSTSDSRVRVIGDAQPMNGSGPLPSGFVAMQRADWASAYEQALSNAEKLAASRTWFRARP